MTFDHERHGRALKKIVDAYKAAGKEIKMVSDEERHWNDNQHGYRYDYLNDAGAKLRG